MSPTQLFKLETEPSVRVPASPHFHAVPVRPPMRSRSASRCPADSPLFLHENLPSGSQPHRFSLRRLGRPCSPCPRAACQVTAASSPMVRLLLTVRLRQLQALHRLKLTRSHPEPGFQLGGCSARQAHLGPFPPRSELHAILGF